MSSSSLRLQNVTIKNQHASFSCPKPQTSDTTLEEFLEELDALTDTEPEDQKDPDTKTKPASDPGSTSPCEDGTAAWREDDPAPEKPDPTSPRASEKKVRFSEELVQVAHGRRGTGSQDSEARSPSSLKAPSPKRNGDRGGGPSDPCDTPPTAPSCPPAVNGSDQTVELVKCNVGSAHAGRVSVRLGSDGVWTPPGP